MNIIIQTLSNFRLDAKIICRYLDQVFSDSSAIIYRTSCKAFLITASLLSACDLMFFFLALFGSVKFLLIFNNINAATNLL